MTLEMVDVAEYQRNAAEQVAEEIQARGKDIRCEVHLNIPYWDQPLVKVFAPGQTTASVHATICIDQGDQGAHDVYRSWVLSKAVGRISVLYLGVQ